VVLIVAVFGVYTSFRHVPPPPPAPGCQAGTGAQAIALDTDQAAIAATIAGIAARHKLPKYAVTIAYATALQESRLHDLDYGDRDSVGVFQQRPSQGWGTTAEIEDPVYATTRFFDALVQVPGYTKMPVAQAAQDVQHSADGSAYEQWAPVAAQLTAYFTGISPHDVSCWYTVAPVPVKADLTAAVRSLAQTVGPAGRNGVVVRITLPRSADKDGSSAVLHVRAGAAWTVAGWLVAHAQAYGLSDVRYAGYEWTAADGSMGWQPDSAATSTAAKNDPPGGSIVAG
jgi:hypothetical protein